MGFETCRHLGDEIGLELFFKLLKRQVVSKEAGERGSNVNSIPDNHSSENRRTSSFPKMGGENEMYTTSALLCETRPPRQIMSHKTAQCLMKNHLMADGN